LEKTDDLFFTSIGIITIAVGDAVVSNIPLLYLYCSANWFLQAAIIGSNFGKIKWFGSHKSIAGSLAGWHFLFSSQNIISIQSFSYTFLVLGFLAMTLMYYLIELAQNTTVKHSSPLDFVVLIMLTILEAMTSDPDNVLLPVYGMVLILIVRAFS